MLKASVWLSGLEIALQFKKLKSIVVKQMTQDEHHQREEPQGHSF